MGKNGWAYQAVWSCEQLAADKLLLGLICLCISLAVYLFQLTAAAALQGDLLVAFGALIQLAVLVWQLVVLGLLSVLVAARFQSEKQGRRNLQ